VCDFSRLAVTDWRLRRWRLWFLALMTATGINDKSLRLLAANIVVTRSCLEPGGRTVGAFDSTNRSPEIAKYTRHHTSRNSRRIRGNSSFFGTCDESSANATVLCTDYSSFFL